MILPRGDALGRGIDGALTAMRSHMPALSRHGSCDRRNGRSAAPATAHVAVAAHR
jgi:hypothetical protein